MFEFLKIFGKKEETVEAIELKTDISSAFQKISAIEKIVFSKTYSEAHRLHKEIIASLKILSDNAYHLQKSKVKREMDRRLEKRVMEAQEQIANKTISGCKNICEKNPEFNSFGDIADFVDTVNSALADINKIGARHAEFAEIAFKREMDSIGNSAKAVKQKTGELAEVVKAEEKKFKNFENAISTAKRVNEILEWLKKMAEEKERKSSEIIAMESEIFEFGKKLKELEASAEYKNAIAAKSQMVTLREELNSLKLNFRSSFGSIDKPLRKYLHDNPSDRKTIVGVYLSEPLDGLAADEALEVMAVLKNFGVAVENRRVDIDEKMRGKIVERAAALEKEMPELKKRISEIKSSAEALGSTKFVLDNADELRDRVSMTQKKIEAIKFEIQRLGEENVKKHEWVEKSKKEIEKELSSVNVKIRFSN